MPGDLNEIISEESAFFLHLFFSIFVSVLVGVVMAEDWEFFNSVKSD